MDIAGQNAELPEIRRRARLFAGFVVIAFVGLASRLFYLQIVEGESYYRATSDSIVRTVTLPAVRGQIKDRSGRVLATTRPAYNVVLTPAQLTRESYAAVRKMLAAHLDDLPTWEKVVERARSSPERAYVLAEDVPREVMAAVEQMPDAPGVKIVPVVRRHYPFGTVAAHALGYINEISPDELKSAAASGAYKPSDLIGRTGLERQWEPTLRGEKGFEKMVVDRRGVRRTDINVAEIVEGPARQPAVPGQTLILTLDLDLQKAVERALRAHESAAAVVLEVETGRVLALASRPGFDPNEMSGRLDPDVAARLFSDPHRPFRDKVLSDTYNPGSTFKVVSALASLEDRVITPDERAKCGGFVQVGRRRFRCTKAHGSVNLVNAITQSCNVYFYELAQRPGMMDRLSKYANELGLGAPTGLGLNGDQPGFVPTEAWHRELQQKDPKAEGFVIGNVLNTAIGEGATRVTVLQMALLYATIASEGKLWLPQVVLRVETPDGAAVEEFPPRVRRNISIPPDTMALLRKALIGVVNDSKGTAYKARSTRYLVAGKTGTAQVAQRLDHAWFAGFAPADKPKIAFAVMVEHGGHGGEIAAPIAMDIVETYFDAQAAHTASTTGASP